MSKIQKTFITFGVFWLSLEQAHQRNHIHRYDLQCICAWFHELSGEDSSCDSGRNLGNDSSQRSEVAVLGVYRGGAISG